MHQDQIEIAGCVLNKTLRKIWLIGPRRQQGGSPQIASLGQVPGSIFPPHAWHCRTFFLSLLPRQSLRLTLSCGGEAADVP